MKNILTKSERESLIIALIELSFVACRPLKPGELIEGLPEEKRELANLLTSEDWAKIRYF